MESESRAESPSVLLSIQTLLKAGVLAVVHVVDQPAGASADHSDGVSDRVTIGTACWINKRRGDDGAPAFLPLGSDPQGPTDVAAVHFAGFVVGLEGKSIAEVGFIGRVFLKISGFAF